MDFNFVSTLFPLLHISTRDNIKLQVMSNTIFIKISIKNHQCNRNSQQKKVYKFKKVLNIDYTKYITFQQKS